MDTCKISINQLASFPNKSEKGKISIIKQQKKPKGAVVSLYTQAKKIVAASIINGGNKQIVTRGIEEIKLYIADTDWKLKNKKGSILALETFSKSSIPYILHDNLIESIKPKIKNRLIISDVEIIVSPDLIIKTIIDGIAYYGAIKIHISKSNTFDREEAKYVTTCLYKYMETHYGKNGTILPELCVCVDVFGGSIKYAPIDTEIVTEKLNKMCQEIKIMWANIAA